MKGAQLVLLCAIAVAHADLYGFYNNGCPKDTSIDKLLPHKNCDQYYQCFHGALITRFCPSGLYFNFKLQKCDWTADVKCNEKGEEDNKKDSGNSEELDSNNPNDAVSICLASGSNGLLVAHENCNHFYKCSFGKPIHLMCAKNLLFDPRTEKCDWANKVECGERAIPATSKSNVNSIEKGGIFRSSRSNAIVRNDDKPSQAPTLCAGAGSDGMLIAHENCNQFYKCFGGKPIALICPIDLLYNPNMKYCDWPRNVNCENRIIPEIEGISDTEDEGKSNESDEIESSSSETDDDSKNTINFDPSQANAICASSNSDGALIAHENCNQFYKCSGSRPVVLDCPGILVYNPTTEYCDWPNNVDCGNRIKPDMNANGPETNQNDNDSSTPGGQILSDHSDPSDALTICAAQDSDGVLVTHENCDYFYKCNDGLPVALKCPSKLLYNPDKEYCDWPTEVECGDRVIPEHDSEENINENESDDSSNENESGNNHGNPRETSGETSGEASGEMPSETPDICAGNNSDGLLIAHENCNQFYKCFEGKAIVLFCQLNLLFNPGKEYCDWPHNVDCGDRVVPAHGNNNNSGENKDNVTTTLCSSSPDGEIVPHENCGQFYKCLGGQSYPMDCPPGLYYNPVIKVCDWPINVKCGDRFTEEQVFNKHNNDKT